MAMRDRARTIHDELFPGHVSTLKVTDPELIEYFDNFAFDKALGHDNPDARNVPKPRATSPPASTWAATASCSSPSSRSSCLHRLPAHAQPPPHDQ